MYGNGLSFKRLFMIFVFACFQPLVCRSCCCHFCWPSLLGWWWWPCCCCWCKMRTMMKMKMTMTKTKMIMIFSRDWTVLFTSPSICRVTDSRHKHCSTGTIRGRLSYCYLSGLDLCRDTGNPQPKANSFMPQWDKETRNSSAQPVRANQNLNGNGCINMNQPKQTKQAQQPEQPQQPKADSPCRTAGHGRWAELQSSQATQQLSYLCGRQETVPGNSVGRNFDAFGDQFFTWQLLELSGYLLLAIDSPEWRIMVANDSSIQVSVSVLQPETCRTLRMLWTEEFVSTRAGIMRSFGQIEETKRYKKQRVLSMKRSLVGTLWLEIGQLKLAYVV